MLAAASDARSSRAPAACSRIGSHERRLRYHRQMRYLVGLVLPRPRRRRRLSSPAGRAPARRSRSPSPTKYVGQTRAARGRGHGPGRAAVEPSRSSSSRTASRRRSSRSTQPRQGRDQAGRRRPRPHHPRRSASRRVPDLKSGPARIVVTAARPVLYGMRTTAVDGDATTSRSGSSRRASRSSRPSTTSTSAAPRWSSIARRRPTSSRACASATSNTRAIRASGAKRRGRAHRRPGAAGRVLRAALRPGRQHADARCSRATRPATGARADFDHRPSPSRSRRAGSSSTTSSSTASCRRSSTGTTEVKPEGDNLREVPA